MDIVSYVLAKKYADDSIANITERGQADWSQDDETAIDFIKNKPFGVGSHTLVIPASGDEYGRITDLEFAKLLWEKKEVAKYTLHANNLIAGDYAYEQFEQNSDVKISIIFNNGRIRVSVDIETGLIVASINGTGFLDFTISIPEVNTIDDKFIPDSIARKVDIPVAPVTSVNGMTGDVVIEIGGGSGSGGVSNWNDLTNKPFYDVNGSEKILPDRLPDGGVGWTEIGETIIEWDGSIEGLDVVAVGDMTLVRISGLLPSVEAMIGCTVEMADVSSYEINAETIYQVGPIWVVSAPVGDDLLPILYGVGATEYQGISFPATGLYAVLYPDQPYRFSRVTITDEIVHQLDEKFIPDWKRLPNPNKLIFNGAARGEYDGSEEVTIEIPEGFSGSWDDLSDRPLTNGTKMSTIEWDGTHTGITYPTSNLVCKVSDLFSPDMVCVGFTLSDGRTFSVDAGNLSVTESTNNTVYSGDDKYGYCLCVAIVYDTPVTIGNRTYDVVPGVYLSMGALDTTVYKYEAYVTEAHFRYTGLVLADDVIPDSIARKTDIPALDDTLTQSGKAADAAAVGEAIKRISGQNAVQADLSQNDPNQPDYVKGRTHWEENNQTVIEWDGSTDYSDNDSFEHGGSTKVKISDIVPSVSELETALIAVTIGGNDQTMSVKDAYGDSDNWWIEQDTLISFGNVIWVVYDTNVGGEFTGTTISSTGVYFDMSAKTAGIEHAALTYGSTVVHQLDEKWIPDSIARKTDIGQNPSQNGGLSAAAKEALMAVVEAVGVWEHPDPQELIDNLRNALYNAPVASITAVYTQSRTVYATDALDVLRNDLVVTATYTDGSSAVRTDYTLSGVLTAGVSTITATLDGKTATFEVQVAAARIPATGITLSSTALSITAGEAVRLVATVEPANSTDTVVWASSEEAVAAVAQDGTVTPVANGSCKIIATAGDVRAECSVAVSLPLVGYNYGNPYLNYVDSDPTTLGKTDEELRGKWYSAQFTSWGTSLGLTSRIFLHPYGPGTHYIRYVNRILDPMLDFYAFANADIVSNPTKTLGKVGADGSNSGASVTRIGAFDNCELNANDAYGRPNIGKWTTVDGSNAEVQEGFLSLFILTVPEGEYVFMGASEVVVANRIPGYSDKYPINDWYTIFADDPSGNILQIAREA